MEKRQMTFTEREYARLKELVLEAAEFMDTERGDSALPALVVAFEADDYVTLDDED